MTSLKNTFAVSIGLDWADKKHDVCLQFAGKDKRHRPENNFQSLLNVSLMSF